MTSITPSTATGDRRWELHTPRGSILCKSVLHATNGYASHLLPFLSGPSGIVPVRGQIIATRANVPSNVLGIASWSGNEGFEYWFPRPLKKSDSKRRKPLVILGGGREAEQSFELNETDDSVLGSKASEALRRFLPAVFPSKFQEGEQPEAEWVIVLPYHDRARHVYRFLDWDYGFHFAERPFCKYMYMAYCICRPAGP